MGLLTPCFVPRGGVLYTIIVPGGGFLLLSSRVPGFVPGGLDEIDTCINIQWVVPRLVFTWDLSNCTVLWYYLFL